MRYQCRRVFWICLPALGVLVGSAMARSVAAQSAEMQQKLAEVKQGIAANKQSLAQYTWEEQDTILLKGEQKKQNLYQVQLGPDGKPQKSAIGAPAPGNTGGGRLKRRIVEKKKEEYENYAESIKSLIQQYVPPDPIQLQQAYQRGNIMMGPSGGGPGQYRLVVSNYVKQGDNMTIVFDRSQKDLVSLTIATYLSDPSDAVNVTAQFSRLPGGPNHVAAETINGVSKQLTISIQNSNYQKM